MTPGPIWSVRPDLFSRVKPPTTTEYLSVIMSEVNHNTEDIKDVKKWMEKIDARLDVVERCACILERENLSERVGALEGLHNQLKGAYALILFLFALIGAGIVRRGGV